MPDVPQSESTVEDRLTAYFGGGKQAPQPVPQPQNESQPVSEEAEEAPQAEADQSDQQEVEQEQVSDGPPEGFVELEHLGNKYFVPPDLKTAFEANRAQATRETQALADVRKALEIERVALQSTKTFDKEVSELNAKVAQLQSYKDQARKLDWSQLTLDQKVDLDRELRSIDEQLNSLNGEISAKRSEGQQKFGQYVVQAVQATEQYMSKKVNNWNVDTGKALHEYGLNNGIPVEKLTSGWFSDPIATHIMWKASQWDRLQSGKPQVTQKASNAPPVIKPSSAAVVQSQKNSAYKQARSDLKKTGSLDAFANALLARQNKR